MNNRYLDLTFGHELAENDFLLKTNSGISDHIRHIGSDASSYHVVQQQIVHLLQCFCD